MIQLLFVVVWAEAGVVVLLLVKTPLRRLAFLGLDRIKGERGPVEARTVAAAFFVALLSSALHSLLMLKVQRHPRSDSAGSVVQNPTNHLLCGRHLLDASLVGISLFLGLVVDRVHHHLKELRALTKNVEAMTRKSRVAKEERNGALRVLIARGREIGRLKASIEDRSRAAEEERSGALGLLTARDAEIARLTARISDQIRAAEEERSGALEASSLLTARDGEIARLEARISDQIWAAEEERRGAREALAARDGEIAQLKARIADLESKFEARLRDANAADENAMALKKQSEGFLLEYDRLLRDNQNLRTHLKSLDRRLSRSESNKFS